MDTHAIGMIFYILFIFSFVYLIYYNIYLSLIEILKVIFFNPNFKYILTWSYILNN